MKSFLFPLQKRSSYLLFCGVMVVCLLCSFVLAIRLGSIQLDFETIGKVLGNRLAGKEVFPVTWQSSTEQIIWNIRTPRILTAFVVGAGLTLCGILMQALTKNSLADPYVLGISQGASAGAVSVILYGYLPFLGGYSSMTGAFVGSVIAMVLTLKFATIGRQITATKLVLGGIAVAALFGAVTNFMIYNTRVGSDKVRTATHWMFGSLNGSSWEKLQYLSIAFLVCFLLILLLSKKLDVLLLGDEVAATIGLDTARIKLQIIFVATLLTGIIVSVSGIIGFVGLTFPHIARSIVGTKHHRLLPASMLIGGTFLVLADILSRTLSSPEELPIGVVSAFFGAPFFLYLIRQGQGG